MTISSLMIKGICVGIILPVYNAESTINRCLDSIFAQSYSNWKLYIINDCSTDHVVELINKYTDDPRIVLINLSENKGVSYARNYGLNIADEDYISFIDSDDEWLPTKLSKQIRLLDQNTKIVLSNYFFIKSKKNKIISYYKDVLSIDDFLKKKYRICFSSLLFYKGENKFNFIEMGHEDFEFIYKLLSKYHYARICKKPLVNYYVQENSLSSNKIRAYIWHYNILKVIFPTSICKRIKFFIYYIWNAIKFRADFK